MKIAYTRPDGGVSVVTAAPKENLEKVLGPMTDNEYEDHVLQRSIPLDATKVRKITEDDIPESREFRDAWADITKSSMIDIDCEKAKDIKLEELRTIRNTELAKTDSEMTRALESEDKEAIEALKEKRQALRDATEPLKALDVEGKVNDIEALSQIKQLSTLT